MLYGDASSMANLVLRFVLQPDGRKDAVEVIGTPPLAAGTEMCVRAAVRAAKLPSSDDGHPQKLEMTYRFESKTDK